MKHMIAFLMMVGSMAQAGERVISDQVVRLPVRINSETVKLSAAGYSRPMVKVLVPGLADVTVLNHRNEGEGAQSR